ncbi:MAG: hypothetical protein INQ03_03090 [Candidatus Heimdallarchaeota archaeon]|nr:hypothetical protein [Candidatus Heimdallarchaeota archaeon]
MKQNPEFVIILSQSGTPLVTQLISPQKDIPEPALISGFLSAIHSFFSQFISGDSDFLEIKVEDQFLVILKAKEGDFFIGGMINEVTDDLRLTLSEIATQFADLVNLDAKFVTIDESLYFLFQSLVIQSFAQYQIKLSWVPKIKQGQSISGYDFLKWIDGKMTVRQFAMHTSTNIESLRKEFFNLWLQGILDFDDTLKEEDYIYMNALSKTLMVDLFADKDKRDIVCSDFEMRVDSNDLLREIYEPVKIRNLMDSHGDDIMPLLNCLFQKNRINVLPVNIKQLKLIKDITQHLLDIHHANFGFDETIVTNCVNDLEYLGIQYELKIINNYFFIESSIHSYLKLGSGVIAKYRSAWIQFISKILSRLDEIKRELIIEQLMEQAHDLILDFYNDVGDINEADSDLLYLFEKYNI